MSKFPETIGAGCRVVMHCSLSLPDDTEFLSTYGEEPLVFTLGDGTLQPSLESCLYGLMVSEQRTLTLEPGQVWGFYDEALLQSMPRDQFTEAQQPELGQYIGFALPNGEQTAGLVIEVDEGSVLLDFNHPLAGQPVVFQFEILQVETPGESDD